MRDSLLSFILGDLHKVQYGDLHDFPSYHSDNSQLDGICADVQLFVVILHGQKEYGYRICTVELRNQWDFVQCDVFALSKPVKSLSQTQR